MKFKILSIDTEKISYNIEYSDNGILGFPSKIKEGEKSIKYLITVFKALEFLTPELKHKILIEILSTEIKEELFLEQFEENLEIELNFALDFEDILKNYPQIEYNSDEFHFPDNYLDPDLGYYLSD